MTLKSIIIYCFFLWEKAIIYGKCTAMFLVKNVRRTVKTSIKFSSFYGSDLTGMQKVRLFQKQICKAIGFSQQTLASRLLIKVTKYSLVDDSNRYII